MVFFHGTNVVHVNHNVEMDTNLNVKNVKKIIVDFVLKFIVKIQNTNISTKNLITNNLFQFS